MSLRKGSLAWTFQPICLPLLAGSFVRIWNFWTPGLWLDEFATQWAAGAPTLAICWQRSIHYLANSPFYFAIVRGSLLLFGESEFALRLPSVLAGIAAIYLTYLLGRELFSDETALMAAWCLALHPWFIDQSQNARVYSLAVCFALMASLAFFRSFGSARSRDVWFYAVASAGLIYLQFLFALFVLFQSIFWIWMVMKCKQEARHDALKHWFLAHLWTVILILPLFPQIYRLWLRRHGLQYQFSADLPYFLALFGPEILIVICLIFSFLPVYFLSKMGSYPKVSFLKPPTRIYAFAYFTAWFFLPWPFYLISWKLTGSNSMVIVRYLIIYLIPANFLWGWIITAVKMPRLKWIWISLFLLLNFRLYLYSNYTRTGTFSTSHGEDWRGAIHYLESNFSDDGLILLRSGLVEGDLLLEPNALDPNWIQLIRCPFGMFYVRKDWKILDLPYHWEQPSARQHLEETLMPAIRQARDFWLVSRKGQESERFLALFQSNLAEENLNLKVDKKNDQFGLSLIHYVRE